MARRPVPPMAWVLAGATGVAVVVLLIPIGHEHGLAWFFRQGDAGYFRAVAVDPFGTGRAIARAGAASEIAFRYGRPGLPFLAWIVALGHPAWVPWALIGIQVVATAAIPGLAAVLADEHSVPPAVGAVVLLSPMLLLLGLVFAEPLMIALVLLAYALQYRGRHQWGLAVFAYAVLVKETAGLALLPWGYRSLRARRYREASSFLIPFVPYAVWCVVVRIRMGELPFLARTLSRREAVGWPGEALRFIVRQHTPEYRSVAANVVATFALCIVAAVAMRRSELGGLAAALAVFVACLGVNSLRYSQETFRLLMFPQTCALLAVGIAVAQRRRNRLPVAPAESVGVCGQPAMPSSGARNCPV